VVTRSFTAPRQKVFDALTIPDQIVRWLQPAQMSLVTCEVDFRAGGAYRYVFQRPGGKRLEMSGVYREVEAPHRWVYTETYSFSPLTPLVTNTLDDAGLTQTILYGSSAERDADFDAVSDSASELYAKLDLYLES
jgi:uncharacterized protein YndB with AHSA1/START domain